MMRENHSMGRTSRPASFPNAAMNAANLTQPPPHSSQKIKDVTGRLRNLNFRDPKNKMKRLSLTDSEASDSASIGQSRGAGGAVITSRQNLQKQSTNKTKNEKLLKIRAGLENNQNQYERVDVARETVVNAIEKKMQQENDDYETHGHNYGEVYYRVQNNVSGYPQHGLKDQMNVVTLSRGSPDGASYRAESPSTFHTAMHNQSMIGNSHYEPVNPVVLPTGNSKYMGTQKQPTTDPPAYGNPHMFYEYSGQNSIASDNSSSTGTCSQYLSSIGSYSGNPQPHVAHAMYETGGSKYFYPEQRQVQLYSDNVPGQAIMEDGPIHSQDPISMHRPPIIKGIPTNPPPSYQVSQNFKNKQIQSNDQRGVLAINSALTGNLNAIRYENNPTVIHTNQYQTSLDTTAFTPAIRQAVSSQPVSKPIPMTANIPSSKDVYYRNYKDIDRTDSNMRPQQNQQYLLLQDRKPPPYVSKRNSASLENQMQAVQINNGHTATSYESDKNKSDNFQKPKIAESYLNAVESQSRNVSSVQQARANLSTKYNQPVPQDAEAAAKAARVTASNTKRSAGSYSQVCSAKQHRAEPPAYESKDIRTSPVPQRKSYRDKSGKRPQQIQCMQVSDSDDEDDSTNPEEEPRIRRVKVYSPEAFKFYMEQHIENIIKGMRSRNCRRMQLEYEMNKMNLPEEERNQMRKMLFQKESNHIRLKRARIHKNMFDIIKKLGVGAFGEVMLARRKTTGALFAIKILKKKEVLSKNQVAHVKAERDILAEADNDWVVRLYYTFQDKERLYFVMDYIPGGDLMSLLIRKGIFDEGLALFYTAELCLALESVHKMGFIHRDIKPDNILIDRDGHIKLTDFGLCTGFRWTHDSKYYLKDGHKRQDSMDFSNEWRAMSVGLANKLKTLDRRRMIDANRHTAKSLVGTPNYIAPEVLLREGYTELCDWWSVGVILYEMVIGQPPFNAPTPDETQLKVIRWRECLTFPNYVKISHHTENLIKCLCCDKENRLGKRGPEEIKQHRYFDGINWATLRQVKPPFVPPIKHPEDTSNFDCPDNDLQLNPSMSATMNSNHPTMLRPGEHAFFEFTFRRFFDEDGRAYQLGSNSVQPGAEFVQTIEMEDDTPPPSNYYSNV